MSKLFAGCLKLQVEIDRYKGIDRNQRFCKLCNVNLVEDNSHFLWECTELIDKRAELERYLNLEDKTSAEKCTILSEKMDDKIAKEIYRIWTARNNKLYK